MTDIVDLKKVAAMYGVAVAEHEHDKSGDSLDAMEIAEQEFEAMFSQLAAQMTATNNRLADVAMICRLMERRLRQHGHSDLADKAKDLLRRHQLLGSPLRMETNT